MLLYARVCCLYVQNNLSPTISKYFMNYTKHVYNFNVCGLNCIKFIYIFKMACCWCYTKDSYTNKFSVTYC